MPTGTAVESAAHATDILADECLEMATVSAFPSRAGKYVTFQISRHYFAIEARRVKQVAPAKDVTPTEHALSCLRGVMLVRGRRVPVIDLRTRLGLSDRGTHPRSSVLLLDIADVCGLPMLGLVVDRACEVVEFRDKDFRDSLIQLRAHGRPYGRPKTLLDPDSLLEREELASLKSIF